MTHSVCSHLAGSSQQPLAVILDGHGCEQFMCASCVSEQACNLLAETTPNAVSKAIHLDRCNHGNTPMPSGACYPCAVGVCGMLLSLQSLAAFQDRQLSNRIKSLLRYIHQRVFANSPIIGTVPH
jgi:hypothetical protein